MGDYDNNIVPGDGSKELTNLFPKLSSSELSVYKPVNITRVVLNLLLLKLF